MAVLLVVIFHAGLPLPGGFTGVDVFFVISGFVITRLLNRELATYGTIRFSRFYARRVRRLLPALALVLVFVAAGSLIFQSALGYQQITGQTGAGAALFLANAVLFVTTGGYFDAAAEDNPLLHTWTLAVEEQFYLLFPLLLWLAWRGRRRVATKATRAIAVVSAVLLLSLLLCLFMTFSTGAPFGQLPHNRSFAFYGSPTRAWEFAAGALIALNEDRIRRWLSTSAASVLALVGTAVVLLTALLLTNETPFPGFAAIAPVLGTSALIAAGCRQHALAARWLRLQPLVWLGDLSYSWYLWHWPVIVFLLAAVPDAPTSLVAIVAALSILPAWASYRFVEQPFRFNHTIVGRRAMALAAACALIPIVAFAGLYASTLRPPSKVAALVDDIQPHYDARGCQGNLPNDAATTSSCTWAVPDSRGTVLLLGDSNAGHFAEPLQEAANESGFTFVHATWGGCPPADLEIVYDTPFDTAGCRTFVESWKDEVLARKPEVVVLASSATSYLQSEKVSYRAGPSSPLVSSEEGKAKAYEEGLRDLVKPWSRAGVKTLIVHPVPRFRDFDLRACSTLTIYRDLSDCGQTMPMTAAAEQIAPAVRAERAVAESDPSVSTLALLDAICPGRTCSTDRDDSFVYRDGAHLSVPFARSLEPRFVAALRLLAGDPAGNA